MAKKLPKKAAKKVPEKERGRDAEFGALPRVVGGTVVTDENQAAYNEPTAWNPGHVPPFECRLVESVFSTQTSVRTKNKEYKICSTIPALSSTLFKINMKNNGTKQQLNDWLVTYAFAFDCNISKIVIYIIRKLYI